MYSPFACWGEKILVVGDSLIDNYMLGTTTEFDQTRPIPKWKVGLKHRSPGGAGLIATILTDLGANITLLSPAAQGKEGFENLSIRPEHTFEAACSGLSVRNRIYGQGGLAVRFDEDWRGMQPPRIPLAELEHTASDTKILVWADYGPQCGQAGIIPASLEPFLPEDVVRVVSCKDGDLLHQFSRIDFLILNLKEARSLLTDLDVLELVGKNATREDADHVAAILQKKYKVKKAVIVTCGYKGCALAYWHTAGACSTVLTEMIPPVRVVEADSTGAGDAFLVGFLHGWIESGDPVHAARRGNQFGAKMASMTGTGFLNLMDLNQYLASLLRNTETGEPLPLASLKQVVDIPRMTQELQNFKKHRGKLIATNGCFDCLHLGHLHLLKKAREQGDYLIVLVNSDDSVKQLKGEGRPIQPLTMREQMLRTCPFVDLVVPFNYEEELDTWLWVISPDVLVKGAEYDGKEVVGAKYAKKVYYVDHVTEVSTTSLVERAKAQ